MIAPILRLRRPFSFAEGMTSAVGPSTFIICRSWTSIHWIFCYKSLLSVHFNTGSFFGKTGVVRSWAWKTIDIDDAFGLMGKRYCEVLFIAGCLVWAGSWGWWNDLFYSLFMSKYPELMWLLNWNRVVPIRSWLFLQWCFFSELSTQSKWYDLYFQVGDLERVALVLGL
jgi:hypothetical protein